MECRCDRISYMDHTMVSMIADIKLDTKSDIRDIDNKLDTANENIGKITDSVNQIKLDTEKNKKNLEALNNRLSSCERRVEILENDPKLFKTKIDRFTETMSEWNKERISRDEFTNLADNIESTSNKLQQMKQGELKGTLTKF